MSEKLKDKSCAEFTQLMASTAPAPGGGGASAMLAAMAVSLGDMVGEFTVGKKKYAEVEEELRALMARSQELRLRFLELIDEDAEKFLPLAAAYGIPKDAPGRDEELERCLRIAIEAPMEIFRLSLEVAAILEVFEKKGSRLLISDASTGKAFIRAALEGAAINVKVNTRLMKDRAYAEETERYLDEKMRDAVWQYS